MSETITVIADASGLNGRQVNPNNKETDYSTWFRFEQNVSTYPFTKQVEGGSVIRCKEIWQYKLKTETKWTSDLNMRHQGQTFEHWEYDLKMMSNDFEGRQTYQPIKQPKQIFKLDGKPCTEKQYYDTKYASAFLEGLPNPEIVEQPKEEKDVDIYINCKKALPICGCKSIEDCLFFGGDQGIVEQPKEEKKSAQITIGDTSFTKLQDGFIQILTKNGCVELMPDEIKQLVNFIKP